MRGKKVLAGMLFICAVILLLSGTVGTAFAFSNSGDGNQNPVVSGVLEVSDTIENIGTVNTNLITSTLYNQNGIVIWQVTPNVDVNKYYLTDLKFYAMLNKNENKLSILIDCSEESKALRGMIPSLRNGENRALSSNPDHAHYCHNYNSHKTLIYDVLEEAFDELKDKSVIASSASLNSNPSYRSSFTDKIYIFGYYLTATEYNCNWHCFHNWPWGSGNDLCNYGKREGKPGCYACEYSDGTVEITFDYSISNPKHYYAYGCNCNDNGEETKYTYNGNLWLHQVNCGFKQDVKYGTTDFPAQITLYGHKTWSKNCLMTWMVIDADSVTATGHIHGEGPTTIDRNEEPDVLTSIDLQKVTLNWPLSSTTCGRITNWKTMCQGVYSPGQKVGAEMEFENLMTGGYNFKGVILIRSPTGDEYTNSEVEWVPSAPNPHGKFAAGDALYVTIPEGASAGKYDMKLELWNDDTDELCDETEWKEGLFSVDQGITDAVLIMHFDEGSGTVAKDSSGYGNDGTIHGATWTTGVSGKALSFDGVDDYVDCGNDESLDITDAVTIAAWVNPANSGQGGYGRIVDKLDSSAPRNGYDFTVKSGTPQLRVKFHTGDAGIVLESTDDSVNKNEWTHVAVTYDKDAGSNNLKIYINGLQDNQGADTDAIPTSSVNLRIGNSQSWARAFDGIIDEVHIYNRALTESEIKALYEQGGDTTPSNLLENTGFESGVLDPWYSTTYYDPYKKCDWINIDVDSEARYEGDYGAYIDIRCSLDAWGRIIQEPVEITPGEKLAVEAKLMYEGDLNDGYAELWLVFLDADKKSLDHVYKKYYLSDFGAEDKWLSAVLPATTAPSNAKYVRIMVGLADVKSCRLNIDDVMLKYGSAIGNHPPTATKIEPTSDSITIEPGDTQEFKVKAEDVDVEVHNNLKMIEWFVDDVWMETDAADGKSAEVSFSYTFENTGTFSVKATVHDEQMEEASVTWEVNVRVVLLLDANCVDIGDADNDGDNEIVIGKEKEIVILSYESGEWKEDRIYDIGDLWPVITISKISTLTIEDADSDGNNEIILGTSATGGMVGLTNYVITLSKNQEGMWVKEEIGTVAQNIVALEVGDANNDRKNEVVVIESGLRESVIAYKKVGKDWIREDISRAYYVDTPYLLDAQIKDVCIGDADADGKNEVVIAMTIYVIGEGNYFTGSGPVIVFSYDGEWNKEQMIRYIGKGTTTVTIGDGNNDGIKRIFVGLTNGEVIAYKSSNEEWIAEDIKGDISRSYISDILVEDCDGDGLNEVLVTTKLFYSIWMTYPSYVLVYDYIDDEWCETKIAEVGKTINSAVVGNVKNIGNIIVVSTGIEPMPGALSNSYN